MEFLREKKKRKRNLLQKFRDYREKKIRPQK